MTAMDAERQKLIDRGAWLLKEINLIFNTAEHWNETTRVRLYPDDPPIDPDPGGELSKIKIGLERMLRLEAELGNFPTRVI